MASEALRKQISDSFDSMIPNLNTPKPCHSEQNPLPIRVKNAIQPIQCGGSVGFGHGRVVERGCQKISVVGGAR